MYNRDFINFGNTPIYYPTSTGNAYLDSYALNHSYFSQQRTDIGICLGLQSVNLNKAPKYAENISLRSRLPCCVNTYNSNVNSNHLLYKHNEIQYYEFNRNHLVNYYVHDVQHSANIRNYSGGNINEQQVVTESATFNSKWIDNNQEAPPKKKWIRDYMMSNSQF